MKALYRKYRPTKLTDVLGQDQVKKPLEEALKSGKISHAYLFTGPRGCGKTSVARIFAHEINGFKYEIEDSYVDIIEIDAASNTGVDNIRELREKAMVAPSKGAYKVYIIDEIHMLTKSAFNALLKTLEEPPKSVIFIMATTDMHKVPDTIVSRAQVYNFNLAEPKIMQEYLKKIAKKEKIKIKDDAISVIVKRGGGSFRDSISLLDQISTLSAEEITKESVLDVLGLPDGEVVADLLSAFADGDVNKITDLLHQQLNSGKKAEILAENLIAAIINNPDPKYLPLLDRLPEVKAPFPEAKLLMAFLKDAAKNPVLKIIEAKPSAKPNNIKEPESEKPQKIEEESKKETEKIPEKPPRDEKKPEKTEEKSKKPGKKIELNWADYLKNIRSKNPALARILENCVTDRDGDTILVYVERRGHRNILETEKNFPILQRFLPAGLSIEIHDLAEHAIKNEKLSKISDIMGGVTEVQTDGVPFK